jgi:hypothetical protein
LRGTHVCLTLNSTVVRQSFNQGECICHRVPEPATELGIVVRCIELGAEDYLPRPFNPVLPRARLRTVLEKKWLRAKLGTDFGCRL